MDTLFLSLEPTPQHQNSITINRRRPRTQLHQDPTQNPLPCPRCHSSLTKFCYYNNYNLSQPRHFCKSCRRYWTQGGTLRPIPVGGATRNNNNSVKRQRVRQSVTKVTSNEAVAVAEVGPGPVVVDLNESWWNGLTDVGLEESYGLGVLDWPIAGVGSEEGNNGSVSWLEIGTLTPAGNEV